MSCLKEHNGKFSSKRIAGLTVIAVSIILAIIDQTTDMKANEMIWITMFGAGMTMIGLTLIKK